MFYVLHCPESAGLADNLSQWPNAYDLGTQGNRHSFDDGNMLPYARADAAGFLIPTCKEKMSLHRGDEERMELPLQ